MTAGPIGLLGGGEMHPGCTEFDQALLAAAGHPPQVHVVPAALARNGSPGQAMALARRHFGGLGSEAIEVPLLRRADANRPEVAAMLRGARAIYLLGGDPGHLLDVLEGSRAWSEILAAVAEGAALAGSSAGAMVMCSALLLRSRNPRPEMRHGRDALGLLPGVLAAPHFNTFGVGWLAAARRERPDLGVLCLDEATGVIHHQGNWTAHGPGSVGTWAPGAESATDAGAGALVTLPTPVLL